MERIFKFDGVNSDARKKIEAREHEKMPPIRLLRREVPVRIDISPTHRAKIIWSGKEDFNN